MSVEKISHIGIAVESIEKWLSYYKDVLGLEYTGSEEVAEQKVRVAFLKIGESQIELLEPTSDDSPIAKFLEKRGGGIHHIAIKVDDINTALTRHHEAGAQLIDNEPRIGAHNMRIAFIHPKTSGGVLMELCEEPP
ncbi:MAG: methylmalonyl-CoA epimerase [Candidatus Thorarchaeota archaeon SMTZ-45]|nr:MAG: methylmalonyl-CoA epimerase [Candidatus Thorarchaeota archaeon SMTZ-45]KXH75807.1 MAG: methylmalonyl-CoA epimerase [Candidatus Thorarchaeota archaeon SMTZ1-45]